MYKNKSSIYSVPINTHENKGLFFSLQLDLVVYWWVTISGTKPPLVERERFVSVIKDRNSIRGKCGLSEPVYSPA